MLIENNAAEATDREEGDETEAEADETEASETAQKKDPLDLIEDEAERNEAKRLRAIAQRKLRKGETEKEEAEPAPISTAYATKDDLKKLATNEAKKLVAPEVKDVWDELVAIPLGGFDPMDAESIAKNMQQRYVLHQQSNQSSDDPTKDFTKTPVIPQGGGAKSTTKAADQAPKLPGYREPTPPSEWYK